MTDCFSRCLPVRQPLCVRIANRNSLFTKFTECLGHSTLKSVHAFHFFIFDLPAFMLIMPTRAVIINPIFKFKFPFHVIFSKSPMQVQGRLLLSIKMKPLYPVKTVTIPNVIHKPNNR